MRRSLILPLLAALLSSLASGCPEREKVADEVGGAPGRIMDQMKKAAERAQDQAAEREKRQLGEE